MKEKTSAAYSARRGERRIEELWLICLFKGPSFFEAFRQKEKRDRDEKNADGNGGAERPVVDGAKKGLHNVGDHGAGGTADEKGREEIAKRKNEGEGGSGDDAGHGERKDYAEKSRDW